MRALRRYRKQNQDGVYCGVGSCMLVCMCWRCTGCQTASLKSSRFFGSSDWLHLLSYCISASVCPINTRLLSRAKPGWWIFNFWQLWVHLRLLHRGSHLLSTPPCREGRRCNSHLVASLLFTENSAHIYRSSVFVKLVHILMLSQILICLFCLLRSIKVLHQYPRCMCS